MRKVLIFLVVVLIVTGWSCGNQGWKKSQKMSENSIVQADDGTISLKMEDAAFYRNVENPATNTAEWSVYVSKPGRYGVWLSSATKDTVDLSSSGNVKVTMLDTELEVVPGADRIISNSSEVSYPYFRADSYVGSFFVAEAGEFSIQVMSEMVLPVEARNQDERQADDIRLMSVKLTPSTR